MEAHNQVQEQVAERIEQVRKVYKKGRDVAQDFDTVINLLKNYVNISKDEEDDLFVYRFFLEGSIYSLLPTWDEQLEESYSRDIKPVLEKIFKILVEDESLINNFIKQLDEAVEIYKEEMVLYELEFIKVLNNIVVSIIESSQKLNDEFKRLVKETSSYRIERLETLNKEVNELYKLKHIYEYYLEYKEKLGELIEFEDVVIFSIFLDLIEALNSINKLEENKIDIARAWLAISFFV
jgi:hypothetical protein